MKEEEQKLIYNNNSFTIDDTGFVNSKIPISDVPYILAKELIQIKEENEKLKQKNIDLDNGFQAIELSHTTLENELTIALDALEKIGNQKIGTEFDNLCNLRLEDCTNACKECFQHIAKQAISKINSNKGGEGRLRGEWE